MATTLAFNGRVTAIPGSYSQVDASGLSVVGLGASGIVACIGEAQGGQPAIVHSITNPGKVGKTFLDGDLREAAPMLFQPSNDAEVPAGAQEIKFVKVNPATTSTVTLQNADGNALTLTSLDHGIHTTQINVSVAAGTTVGKAYTIVYATTEEVFDDVGGVAAFTALYTPGATGATTMLVALANSTGVTATFTKTSAGLDSEITAPAPGAESVQVESSAAGDSTQTVTIYGTDAGGDPQTEVLSLDGTTPVVGVAIWSDVLGVILSAACVGTVTTKSNPTTGTTILSIAPAGLTAGIRLVDNLTVSSSVLTYVRSGAGTETIAAFGLNGQTAVGEAVALNGTTPVAGTQVFTELTVLAVGELAAAGTLTVSGTTANLPLAQYATVQEIADRFNALDGWTVTPAASAGPILIADMDDSAASTVIGSAKSFNADLAFAISKINNESQLVSAAAASGFTGPPSNTAAPVYLTGGIEGATAFSDWQAALDVLRDERVNTVVALTDDAAVHAAVVAHCAFGAGAGRSERDCVLGEESGISFTAAKAAAAAIGSRHARLCIQDVDRFNVAGVREVFPPYFTACLIAGMQAGTTVGTSLTAKFPNVLNVVGNDATYTIKDDADEIIRSGILALEKVPYVGFRVLRNVTTYLIDPTNLAFTEASVNEAVNYSVFTLRTALEIAIGRKGFQGTVDAVISEAVTVLGLLMDEQIIVNWRNLTVELEADIMTVDVELAPVTPVNFVATTVHLVTASFSAAA
jgi:hypothetical protein